MLAGDQTSLKHTHELWNTTLNVIEMVPTMKSVFTTDYIIFDPVIRIFKAITFITLWGVGAHW